MATFPRLVLSASEKKNLSVIGGSLFLGVAVLGGSISSEVNATTTVEDWLTTSPTDDVIIELQKADDVVKSVGPVAVSAGVYMLCMQPVKRFVFS